MKPHVLVFALAVAIPASVNAAGLPPWQFGMSKSQIASFKEFGPYKPFSNGDLETPNGRFDGRKENIQFFFQGDQLQRIGIYLFEGKDPKQGVPVFQRAYDYLEKHYGKVAVPQMKVLPGSEAPNSAGIAIAAGANADVTSKTEMYPVTQPKDMRVSAEFMSYSARDGKWYAVAIFLDPKA